MWNLFKIKRNIKADEYAVIYKKDGHYFYHSSQMGVVEFFKFWEGFLDSDNDYANRISASAIELSIKRSDYFSKEKFWYKALMRDKRIREKWLEENGKSKR